NEIHSSKSPARSFVFLEDCLLAWQLCVMLKTPRIEGFLFLMSELTRTHLPASPPLIPLRDFFRNPEKTSFKISPDGRYVSHMEPFGPAGEQRLNVFVQQREELGKGTPMRVTNETARDIGGHWWKNDHRIVYTRDFGGD